MTRPLMAVVAGPSGSGKSHHFPVDAFGGDAFNVDVCAASFNDGSFQSIPREARRRAQKECEAFIDDHIARGQSFAVETTLRSGIAIEQAQRARGAGFETSMIFVVGGSADECVRRVCMRGLGGGHAAPEEELRDIYTRSLANLCVARDVFERIELYDNSAWLLAPRLVGRVRGGQLLALVDPLPEWVPAPLR